MLFCRMSMLRSEALNNPRTPLGTPGHTRAKHINEGKYIQFGPKKGSKPVLKNYSDIDDDTVEAPLHVH